MLSNRDDGGCNGSLDDCHVFFLEAAAVCFCHDECFEGNFNCCKDICKFTNLKSFLYSDLVSR